MLRINKYIILFSAFVALAFVSCDEDDDRPSRGHVPGGNSLKVEANRFVHEVMTDYYYWYDQMPNLDYRAQDNTEDYFYSLLYKDDIFSFISDDADGYSKEVSGQSTSMGWEYVFMVYDDDDDKIYVNINYVYKDTPSYIAGAKRGDLIYKVDGERLTKSNYISLFGKTTAKYTVSRYDVQKNEFYDLEYEITADEIDVSPVAEHSVFERAGKKVGYLLYMDYFSHFDDELTSVFADFKSQGVRELILDLRYNRGGYMTAMQHLCSLIAPQKNVANGDLLVYYDFNDKLSAAAEYSRDSASVFFDASLASSSLDLDRVFILAGNDTYSASESTIIGLEPYMSVYTIGKSTGGKNTTLQIMLPSDFVTMGTGRPYYNPQINNWMVAPIIAVYYNSNDKTIDTSNHTGIDPDYMVDELSYSDMGTLGDADEPLTAIALDFIETGKFPESSNKSAKTTPHVIGHQGHFGGAIIGNNKKVTK